MVCLWPFCPALDTVCFLIVGFPAALVRVEGIIVITTEWSVRVCVFFYLHGGCCCDRTEMVQWGFPMGERGWGTLSWWLFFLLLSFLFIPLLPLFAQFLLDFVPSLFAVQSNNNRDVRKVCLCGIALPPSLPFATGAVYRARRKVRHKGKG